MTRLRRVSGLPGLPLVSALVLCACGAMGGRDGGADDLPDRGLGPWRLSEEGPAIAGLDGLKVRHPTALSDAGGHGLALLVGLEGPEGLAIARLRLTDAGGDDEGALSFAAPEILLAGASEPSGLRDADGGLRLVWVEADGVIATGAVTEADGPEASPELAAVVRTGVVGRSPSLVQTPSGAELVFALVDGAVVRFTPGAEDAPEVVLAPGAGCLDDDGEATDCWDGGAIVDADVRLARTATGRAVYRMVYTAVSGGTHAFGFAASWDGQRWSRYAFNPMLKGEAGARRPTVIPDGDRYLLFYGRVSGSGLGLAIQDTGVASERW